MIPELGHYALVLALALGLIQSVAPIDRRDDARCRADAARDLHRAHAIRASSRFSFRGAGDSATSPRTSRCATVFENSHSMMPLIYKFTSVWGNHEGSMLLWVLILSLFGALVAAFGVNLPATLKALCAGGAVVDRGRLLSVHPAHLEPVPAPAAGAVRGPRSQSDPAGSRPRHSSAAALSRLCRLLDLVLLRHRGADRRPHRRRLGALGAAVDADGLDVPHARHRRWARTGPITRSAGAASGSGTRWRTPR